MTLSEWVGLGYFIPATPSKGRVYVWRRLKALGAQLIRPGVAALPNTARNIEAFKELSDKITELYGEAILIEFNFLTEKETEILRQKFVDASKKRYSEMLESCAVILEKLDATTLSSQRAVLEEQLIKKVNQYQKTAIEHTKMQPDSDLESTMSELFEMLRAIPSELRAIIKNDKID